jgi:hypothetical protein
MQLAPLYDSGHPSDMTNRAFMIAGILVVGACGESGQPEAPTADAVEPAAVISSAKIGPDFHAVVVRADIAPTAFVGLAKDACGAEPICGAGIWVDAATAPRGFPMTDREVASEVFHYRVNRHTGYEQTLWNCGLYPQDDAANCGAGSTD